MFHILHLLYLRYGLLSAFGIVFAENLGIPLPTEIVYVIAQGLILRQKYSYLFISFILLLGHVLGSCVSFWLGSRIAEHAHKSKQNKVQKKLADWYKNWGILAVFFARLVGQVRPWSSYVAGSAEMPFAEFLLATIAGTIVFNAISLSVTARILHYSSHHPLFRVILALLFFGGIFVALFFQFRQENKNKEEIGA